MIKITLSPELENPGVECSEISMGTLFIGIINRQKSLYLCTYSGFVDLRNPARTWSHDDGLRVREFEPVNAEINVTRMAT